MSKSKIEWTDETWNPVTGCRKISPGCMHCYAERFAERFRNVPGHPYESGFDLKLRPERLNQPARWTRPRTIFVCSMSDLFEERVPTEYIGRVFFAMDDAPQHRYQILTKRAKRMHNILEINAAQRRLKGMPPLMPNHWFGVSVESPKHFKRIDILRKTAAPVKFLSLEPLLAPMPTLDLTGINWVIVGGESGPRARPMQADWVREIRDNCLAMDVPFFFKQWGGRLPKSGGRELDGRTWDEMPV